MTWYSAGGERGQDEDLRLQFEALAAMSPKEEQVAKAVLEAMIVKKPGQRRHCRYAGAGQSASGEGERRNAGCGQPTHQTTARLVASNQLLKRSHSHPGHRREWLFCFKRRQVRTGLV